MSDESVKRYPCLASQCPMPGSIFPSGASQGSCSYHYGAMPSDWRRITQVLLDWQCVSDEANRCRSVLTDPATMVDVKAQNSEFAAGWARLKPILLGGGWMSALEPKPRENYAQWGKRLEEFLGGRVLGVLTEQIGRQAA